MKFINYSRLCMLALTCLTFIIGCGQIGSEDVEKTESALTCDSNNTRMWPGNSLTDEHPFPYTGYYEHSANPTPVVSPFVHSGTSSGVLIFHHNSFNNAPWVEQFENSPANGGALDGPTNWFQYYQVLTYTDASSPPSGGGPPSIPGGCQQYALLSPAPGVNWNNSLAPFGATYSVGGVIKMFTLLSPSRTIVVDAVINRPMSGSDYDGYHSRLTFTY